MILDAESLELVNAVESLLEGQPPGARQAGADGVGAGDRDLRRSRTRPRRAPSCARCARGRAGGRERRV